ncbi:MAG: DoxX family membrane protein [Methanobacteriota archaeon]|nr:MAG: DoxX family membrane protein [Euryarchaeota archaeon]
MGKLVEKPPLTFNEGLLKEIDLKIVSFSRKYEDRFVRWAMGIVFIWFGILKPLGVSPAEGIVSKTSSMVLPFVNPQAMVWFLGIYEVLIGLFLIIKQLNRLGILMLAFQMPATMLPLLLFPEETFTHIPWGLTLEGQYIVKNFVLMAAAIVIAGRVRESEGEEKIEN